ncbi:MAG TPA: DNA recombination protein RmuC, partial [Methylophilaceae bacterium]|nr:DNA recombination protein RmuC [Methylophilaceae bacterium]
MTNIELLIGLVCLLVLLVAWLIWLGINSTKNTQLLQHFEDKHRDMLQDVNSGLNTLGDRLNNSSQESGERLKSSVAQELTSTREAMQKLQLEQSSNLSQTREMVLEKLHTTLAE